MVGWLEAETALGFGRQPGRWGVGRGLGFVLFGKIGCRRSRMEVVTSYWQETAVAMCRGLQGGLVGFCARIGIDWRRRVYCMEVCLGEGGGELCAFVRLLRCSYRRCEPRT